CAHLVDAPWVPKAGVYAVRQGPVLIENLRRALAEARPFRSYRPQRDFLALLNLGDGTAVGAKWGLTASGRWVFRWKDWIDRRFMRRFQALDEEASVTAEFSSAAAMRASMDVLCGGCAAKLGQSDLERALGRLEPAPLGAAVELGIEHGDDVAAYASRGGPRVVSSVDQFRAFTDDPWLVGRVGAVNAASDVLAKGLRPEIAQAIIALPESAPRNERAELLYQVLAGARRAFDEMGVTLVGGHTTTASELLVGFHVEGFASPDLELLAIDRLEAGSTIVLTKPLGTGVLFHADMLGRARGPWLEEAFDAMLRANDEAARIARAHGARAATDVTGFGLARHLAALLRASEVGGLVDVARLPALAGVPDLFAAGLRSTFHEENERAARGFSSDRTARAHESWPLLFDPQTSGGLLFGVPPERAEETLVALREAGFARSAAIGATRERTEPLLHVTVKAGSPGA
ncbi:MAG: selenide, water dikinase SelD, partial [Gemmatimonadota bacterium]|nr:selenide, water dikinase SelD [Gemmatimonadota bacterium]